MPIAESASNDEDPYYNPIFERLVPSGDQHEELLIGLVAYGLYKVSKRTWVVGFRARYGRTPNDDEYRAHVDSHTDVILDGYKSQAADIVGIYAASVLESEKPKIERDALKGSFSRSFWPSFWASMAFTGALVILVIIASLLGVGLPIQL